MLVCCIIKMKWLCANWEGDGSCEMVWKGQEGSLELGVTTIQRFTFQIKDLNTWNIKYRLSLYSYCYSIVYHNHNIISTMIVCGLHCYCMVYHDRGCVILFPTIVALSNVNPATRLKQNVPIELKRNWNETGTDWIS